MKCLLSLPKTTIAQLDARLHEHVREVAALRLSLDIQSNRIAQQPVKRRMLRNASRRRALLAPLMQALSATPGANAVSVRSSGKRTTLRASI